jgi:uncharacterized membrane protein
MVFVALALGASGCDTRADARLDTAAGVHEDCGTSETSRVWREARARGVVFRATGQEPGWLLEIDDERLLLVLDYGTDTIRAGVPAPVPYEDGRYYRIETAARPVSIAITDTPCQDTMSGERFPSAVEVEVDGRRLVGCGCSLR